MSAQLLGNHDHHGHSHGAPADFSAAFAIGVALNLLIVILQTVRGALISIAGVVAQSDHHVD